ncbi:MAG: hypothetical protein JW809_13615 [Pirellulales bacterium]|nr:hypothetical protein [Pirellulales bacterium]
MKRLLQVVCRAQPSPLRGVVLGVVAVVLAAVASRAQEPQSAQYRVYPLRYQTAADVEKALGPMLAQLAPGTNTHLVADVQNNQLLLRGPRAAQEVARQLIDSIDRPAPVQPIPPPPQPLGQPVVRAYGCPPERLAEAAQRLETTYGAAAGVRVAANQQTAQLFVLAPPEVHEAISRQLAALGLHGAAAATGGEPAVREEFVGMAHGRVEQVETALRELLGARLKPIQPRPADGPDYRFENTAGTHADLTVDRRRNGVMLLGSGKLVGQLAHLIRYLDRPRDAADRAVRVLPIRHADPAKVREAVEKYRSQRPGELPPNESQSLYRLPRRPGSRYSPEGIDLVNYEMVTAMLQPAPQPGREGAEPPGQTPPDQREQPPETLRELAPDVDVQILPDLDVIILQGRRRDVQEMARIIAEIERLSVETQPAIEIVGLAHVASDSMATVIAQVRDDLIGGRQGRVSVTSLIKPNALLLIGWGESVGAIRELIQSLDQPVAPDTQLRVFRLTNAPAGQAVATVQQFFADRGGLGPKVLAVADVRTNSLVVQASPRDMAEVATLVESLDAGSSGAVSRARIFKLNNSLAADLGGTLQAAIAAARGGPGAAGRSAVLELLAVEPNGQRVLRSGILADVQVVPDVRTNSLIVTAPAESMELIAALIDRLDAPASVAQIKVFQVVNADANAMIRMLQSLLPAQSVGAAARPQLPTAEGETSLVPVRFSVDVRTNSIIATGSKGDLAIIEALLLRLDGKDVDQRVNTVYRLKNAPATDVARAVNEFLRSERQVQLAAPGSESPFQQIEREVVVVPEPVSNALILSATPRFFKDIEELVQKLDAQPPQVMIQVLIAEVALDNTDEFGVELGLQDSLLFDRSLLSAIEKVVKTTTESSATGIVTTTEETIVSAEQNPGFNFRTQALGNSGADKAIAQANLVGGQGVTTFGVGRTNSELGFGGMVLSAGSESVSVLIRALQECRRLEVLSRPQIMTLDNQSAFIQVGQRVPRIVGTTINATGQVNNIQLEDVGLILGVTPRISPEGMVVMELDAEKSELGSQLEGVPVAISEGAVITSPIVNVTTAQTTVSASSGETIVLGGLIVKSKRTINRRVPWLADIPLVGMLFKYDAQQNRRAELLIILTPWVIRGPEDAERIKQREAARMNWCLADVNCLHGDTGLYQIGNDASYVGAGPMVIYPDARHGGPRTAPPPASLEPWPEPIPPGPRLENVPTPAPLPGDLPPMQQGPTTQTLPLTTPPPERLVPAGRPVQTVQSSPAGPAPYAPWPGQGVAAGSTGYGAAAGVQFAGGEAAPTYDPRRGEPINPAVYAQPQYPGAQPPPPQLSPLYPYGQPQ